LTPIDYFNGAWARCDQLSTIHAYLAKNTSAALQTDDLLRGEWVSRVSAMDLYIHELIAQRMVEIFEGRRPPTSQYLTFRISNDTLRRIQAAQQANRPLDATAAFDLDVRTQLGRETFQAPDNIADGLRLCSLAELWNDVAAHLGAPPPRKIADAKSIKTSLSLIVQRRNKIAHEGDLQPGVPRQPYPISRNDLVTVASQIERIVRAIDAVA
jgi:hypothetical protein